MRFRLFFITFLGISVWAYAQDGQTIDQLFQTKYETPLTIDLEAEIEEDETAPKKKEKKKNPKIFWGIKTKRGYAKTGFGDQTVVELFHYLKDKDYVGPKEYARDFYWYDFKKKKIVNSVRVDRDYAGVMHGHYQKMMGDQVLEEGYFFKGMKHGRWVRYNRNDILQEKELFWKGWPKESMLSYYDFEREQLKEVIPVHFGEKEGEYLAFHTNGNVAAIGQYQFDHRVGIWREYYPDRRIKREVQYPEDPFDNSPPRIIREWDEQGNLIYDRNQYEARLK